MRSIKADYIPQSRARTDIAKYYMQITAHKNTECIKIKTLNQVNPLCLNLTWVQKMSLDKRYKYACILGNIRKYDCQIEQ